MKYLITSDNLAPSNLEDCVILNSYDLNNVDKVNNAMVGVDVVLHLYELKSDPSDKHLFDENVWKTFALVDAAIGAGVKTFIFLSSSEVYGDGKPNHVLEVEPTTSFGCCKSVCEKYIVDSCEGTKTEPFILRIFETPVVESEIGYGNKLARIMIGIGEGKVKEKITNLQLF